MAIDDRIKVDYLNDSSNKVAVIEIRDFGEVNVQGSFSFLSFLNVLRLDGFTILKTKSEKSGSVETTIKYDSNGNHITIVGEAAILPLQHKE